MNVNQIILDLVAEQEQLAEVVAVLERLRPVKRRGRPPAWLAATKKPPQPETNGHRVFSAETRRKMARSQKRRWAEARKVA